MDFFFFNFTWVSFWFCINHYFVIRTKVIGENYDDLSRLHPTMITEFEEECVYLNLVSNMVMMLYFIAKSDPFLDLFNLVISLRFTIFLFL